MMERHLQNSSEDTEQDPNGQVAGGKRIDPRSHALTLRAFAYDAGIQEQGGRDRWEHHSNHHDRPHRE